MFEIEETVTIAQPVEKVWEFVMDDSNEPFWQTGLNDVRRLTDGPLMPGSPVSESRRLLGRALETVWELRACEPSDPSPVASVTAPFARQGTHALEETAAGPRLSMRLQGTPGGFLRIAVSVLERFVRREPAGNLENLPGVPEAGLDRDPGRSDGCVVVVSPRAAPSDAARRLPVRGGRRPPFRAAAWRSAPVGGGGR